MIDNTLQLTLKCMRQIGRHLPARIVLVLGLAVPVAQAQTVTYPDAVCVDTNKGEFCLEMLDEQAPLTVANFLNYVRDGDYDNSVIHRSVPNFVVQGGGFQADPLGTPVPSDGTIQNEFRVANLRGTVAMAQSWGVNSATNQWFVNMADNSALNAAPSQQNPTGLFTVFARVITGMEVVEAINLLNRVNLDEQLGAAFREVPVTGDTSDGVDPEDLVVIHRVYETEVIAEPPVRIPTLFSGTFTADVWYGDTALRAVFRLVAAGSNVYELLGVAELDNPPTLMGEYDESSAILTLPRARVGNNLYSNVRFRASRTVEEVEGRQIEHLLFTVVDYEQQLP